jgi:aquaporin Z
MYNSRKLVAEFIGTFWLVLGGCGAAVLASGVADVGIGWAGVSLAFGLTVLTGAYAFGHISGAHFNPAVTFGIFVAGRMPARDVIPYWVAQVLGGLAAGAVLYAIASGVLSDSPTVFNPASGFAANGYGEHSPQHYSMEAGAICEIVMTFMFLMVILGVTSYKEPAGFAPLAIGLALTLIHLISIPVTNTSVNPARSMGVAFFQGDWAIQQLWFFWVMPMIGAGLAGLVQRWLSAGDKTLVDSKM